jgi:hypothetical protein
MTGERAPDEEPTEAHGGEGAEESGPAGDAQAGSGTVGEGGYAGRDPETDMPRVPSVPETQDDAPRDDDE